MKVHSTGTTAALVLFLSSNALLAQDAPSHLATTPEATIAAAGQTSNVHIGVRIVRLSQVKGGVKLDRNTGESSTPYFENAFANLPITQGATLRTEDGVAEVELEDNSTLRLTPDTTIQFTKLGRESSGFTSSSVKVLQGTLFMSMAPSKGNHFTLLSKEGQFEVAPDTRVHFHEGSPQTTLAVLHGSVEAQVGSSLMTAEKKTTLLFDPANIAPPTLVSHLDKTPYDGWDKSAVDYHKQAMNYASYGGGSGSPIYGMNDMGYYGNFSSAGGCGSMWRPYLASSSWDPYSNGVLAYYPNAGYSWVSPYPWGWTAFHSGSWINCPGAGWGWSPDDTFTGLTNVSTSILKKHGITLPIAPPARPGHGTLLAVNSHPIPLSGFADRGTFVFNEDSAGLGVPRGTFGKLGGISKSALQHGSVSAPAYVSPVSIATATGQRSVSFARSGMNPSLGTSHTFSSSSGWSGATSGGSSAMPAATASSFSSGASHGGGASGGSGGGGHH